MTLIAEYPAALRMATMDPPTIASSRCRTIVNTRQAPSAIGPYSQVLYRLTLSILQLV